VSGPLIAHNPKIDTVDRQTLVVTMTARAQLSSKLLPDGHTLWLDWLRRIDTLLDDEAVIEAVAQALEARRPHSRRGRPGTPADN
jgi:hypothetical protein